MNMKKSVTTFCSLILLTVISNASGADAAAGKEAAASCAGCHGVAGISPAGMFPNIAGQHAEYLESALKQYRDGARENEMMTPMASGLSDETIANLAAYFAGLKAK